MTTGEPFSVLPPFIRQGLDILVAPEPAWTTPVPDWQGLPCHIGRVEVWLPVQGGLPLRPFSLLALLPRREPPQGMPYIQLGLHFLVEYQGRLALDCATSAGQLVLP